MKDTDTPETDKARADYLETIWTSGARITKDLVPIEHARRLERERDEARKRAESYRYKFLTLANQGKPKAEMISRKPFSWEPDTEQ